MSMLWVCDRCGRTEPAVDWGYEGPDMPAGWTTDTRLVGDYCGDYCGDPCWPSHHLSENLHPPVPGYSPTLGSRWIIAPLYQAMVEKMLTGDSTIRVALYTSTSPRPADEPT